MEIFLKLLNFEQSVFLISLQKYIKVFLTSISLLILHNYLKSIKIIVIFTDNQGQLNSVSECLSPAEYYASPILSALIKRRHGSQRNLMRSFSRSVTTTANVSLDIETPQTPVKQHSIDFLDSSNTTNTKKM